MAGLRHGTVPIHKILKSTFQRSFISAANTRFVPPSAQENVQDFRKEIITRPESKTFYTGRSKYYDNIATLEQAVHHTRRLLTTYHLMPLPEFARLSLPPLIPVWQSKEQLSMTLDTRLSATSYRRMIDLLNLLNDFRRIANTAGHSDLGKGIEYILELFEKSNKEDHLRLGKRKPVQFDEHGRTYTLGKRKTSSARVWMISSKHSVEAGKTSNDHVSPPTTQIIINNMPLNVFFRSPMDRERILRPFNLTGLLGAYHVFAIVRGGGTTGQSGSVAHGIVKGLLAHAPDVEPILRRAKLIKRDPRMVERKKTGLAKARKRYTWTKR